jgi:hypothetical protein
MLRIRKEVSSGQGRAATDLAAAFEQSEPSLARRMLSGSGPGTRRTVSTEQGASRATARATHRRASTQNPVRAVRANDYQIHLQIFYLFGNQRLRISC